MFRNLIWHLAQTGTAVRFMMQDTLSTFIVLAIFTAVVVAFFPLAPLASMVLLVGVLAVVHLNYGIYRWQRSRNTVK